MFGRKRMLFGRKRILRVISVLSVAVAAGHLVENMRSTASPWNLPSERSGPLDGRSGQGTATAPSGLPRAASLSADGDMPQLMGITPVAATADTGSQTACVPTVTLAAAEDASIDLALDAPCNQGQRVVIRHAGLSFTAKTGPDGKLAQRLPALDDEALVAVYFENSEMALATVSVPEMAGLTRFAFQAPFPVQFDLRAEEAGRVYSGRGAQAAQDGSRKIRLLGTASVSDPILSQVYTFPGTDLTAANLTVELRITPETCGNSYLGETVLSRGGNTVRGSLPLSLPLCGTAGDILVLKNLLGPLTLAASD